MNCRGIAMACVFLAVAITALPADDQVAEALPADIVPETELYTELHKEATKEVASLMEAGKTKDACASLADQMKKAVEDGQKNTQRLVDRMDVGKNCHTEGLAAYNSAKSAQRNAKTNYDAAKKTATKAANAPIKFSPFTPSQVKTSGCLDVSKDPAYIKAKKATASASKKSTLAKGKYDNSRMATSDALKAHQKAKVACACTAQKNYKAATKATKNFNSAKNAKAWTKAHHMKCVLSGKPASKCTLPRVPRVKAPRMPSWVARTRCSNRPVPSLWKGKTKLCKNVSGRNFKPSQIKQQHMKKFGSGHWRGGCYLGSQINVGEYDYKLGVWVGRTMAKPGDGYWFSAAWGITNRVDGNHNKKSMNFSMRCTTDQGRALMYESPSRNAFNGGGCNCGARSYSEIIVKKDGSVEYWIGKNTKDLRKCRSTPPGTAKGSYVVDTSFNGMRSQLSGVHLQVRKGKSWVAAPDAPKA